MKQLLEIREIKDSDRLALLELRNNPVTYKWFQNPKPVDNEEHDNWIKIRSLKHSNFTLVATLDSQAIGLAYISQNSTDTYEVSVSISLIKRKNKVGTFLLKKLIANAKDAKIKTIYAHIHMENLPSILFFENFGFKMESLLPYPSSKNFHTYSLDLQT